MWRVVILSGCICALLCGAVGCGANEMYVKSDEATYNVIAPAHREYVKNDPKMSPEQKALRFLLLDSWAARIKENKED